VGVGVCCEGGVGGGVVRGGVVGDIFFLRIVFVLCWYFSPYLFVYSFRTFFTFFFVFFFSYFFFSYFFFSYFFCSYIFFSYFSFFHCALGSYPEPLRRAEGRGMADLV
jgi:hypothetical protein